jgi:hypothetical protein
MRSSNFEPNDWERTEYVAIMNALQPAAKMCESESTWQLISQCSLCHAFTAMPRKTKQLSFDEILSNLRGSQFDVQQVSGVAGQYRVQKHGCGAVIAPAGSGNGVAFVSRPGFVLGGEIAHLLDRGFQKSLKTSQLEIAATADHLKAIHRCSEELKEVVGVPSLYNESIGTTSDDYFYDRLKGRDKNPIPRAPAPWDTAGGH